MHHPGKKEKISTSSFQVQRLEEPLSISDTWEDGTLLFGGDVAVKPHCNLNVVSSWVFQTIDEDTNM